MSGIQPLHASLPATVLQNSSSTSSAKARDRYILSWLGDVDTKLEYKREAALNPALKSRKRSRRSRSTDCDCTRLPISPPMSTTPRKRRRPDEDNPLAVAGRSLQGTGTSEDVVPFSRDPFALADSDSQDLTSESYASGLSSTRTPTGPRSGRSSPSKRLAALQLQGDGVDRRAFDLGDPRLPQPLADMLEAIMGFTDEGGVIDAHAKTEIEQYAAADDKRRAFRQCIKPLFIDATERRRKLGETPSPTFVQEILDEARECEDNLYPEASWNSMVHWPVLRHAIIGSGPRSQRADRLVSVVPCTTASILPSYRVRSVPPKMVDYAIVVQPEYDSGQSAPSDEMVPVADVVTNLRTRLPGQSINHTDFIPLRNRPIALSIETKRTNDALDEAKLQISVWLAAQRRALEELSRTSNRAATSEGDEHSRVDVPVAFLPAIIIQGHDWNFAAASMEGKRMVLWSKYRFGDTSSPLGIYKIICVLQYLRWWAETAYWPWFKGECLGLSRPMSH
ncbi:hypothetical protein BX600DRAFT_514369 [Xylariales sp. PMI_506]|nr:hypothetical protein BX600DRAFT_514369 [Xylariales sp. PMI_506]